MNAQSMLEPDAAAGPDAATEPEAAVLENIYARAPRGAMLVAGIATGVVFALWFAFYVFVFIPRGFLR
jgi:hypothetical protein